MKKLKKAALLVLALGTVGALAACGGKNNGGLKGEVFANEAAWLQAVDDTAAATNATVSMSVKMEYHIGNDYILQNSNGTLKIADNKTYMLMNKKAESNNEELLEDFLGEAGVSSTMEMYLGFVNGELQEWFRDDDEAWEQGRPMDDYDGTLGCAVGEILNFPMETLYAGYSYFDVEGDTYVLEEEDGSLEVKFVDGKLYSAIIKERGEEDNTKVNAEMALTFTYGNTTVGALPGQEEEPDGGNGGSSDSEIKLPDVSVDVPDVEDINGSPVANADEWNTIFRDSLAATNATIVATTSSAEKSESGVIMIAYGITYAKWDSYDLYGEVDGQSYHWRSEDGKKWTYEETDWTPAYYATVAFELEGMEQMITFETATWNAETGMYTGDSEIGAYSLKISDGKIVYIAISADSGMMAGAEVVYQILYGQTAAMQLPALDGGNGGGDIDEDIEIEVVIPEGEQVDAETWEAAIGATMSATNFVVNVEMSVYEKEDPTQLIGSALMQMHVADNKGFYVQVAEKGGVSAKMYSYVGTVDGKTYSWISMDGKTWDCSYMGLQEINGAWFMEGMLPSGMTFESVTFDEEVGAYKYVGERDTVYLGFKDGKVAFIITEAPYYTESGEELGRDVWVVSYGGAHVGELPPVESEDGGNGGSSGGSVTLPEGSGDKTEDGYLPPDDNAPTPDDDGSKENEKVDVIG